MVTSPPPWVTPSNHSFCEEILLNAPPLAQLETVSSRRLPGAEPAPHLPTASCQVVCRGRSAFH